MTYIEKPIEQTAAAGQYARERDYWLDKLSGHLEKTTFPYDAGEGEKSERCMKTLTFQLGDPVYGHLLKIGNNADVRLHIILVAGWLMLLHRTTGSSDIIVGIPTYKQETEGKLINTALAIRSTVTGEMTMKELLLKLGPAILEANRNQNYPIETLLYKLNLPGMRMDGDFPLFDISILLEEVHHKGYLDHIRQNMIVSFRKTPSSSSIEGIIEYNSGLYREATMQRIVNHFSQLLANALPDVNILISRVDILTEGERRQLLENFNDNAADFPRDKTVDQFVEDHARKRPEAVAVSFKGEDVAYEQLNRRADGLARVLIEKGVAADTIAAVMMERSIGMVESILAVWKAGGAYLPLDPSYPQERIDYILENSGAAVLLTTDEEFSNKISVSPVAPVAKKQPAAPSCSPLAYVIYTSGSTGKPKGVMVEHIGMMNHIHSKIDLLGITEKSVVAQNASHTFDISVWQFFAAPVRGGRTVIYPETLILDPAQFIPRLMEDGVTILEVVPSYLSVLLDVIDNERGGNAPELMLNYLLVTGEEVKPKLVNRWFEIYPHIKMVNAYGPTEASDDITHYVLDNAPEPGRQRIPIGKPVQNFNIYIVDEYMNLCPVGVKGEICVSGIGVGRGYVKDEEKTRLAFMEDPFVKEKGVRLYKTGDLGAWLADGTVEFFGRKDYQVKISGFRIELGEIENRLLTHPEIKEAVVIDREDEASAKYLCAYIVGKVPDVPGLRKYLGQVLPDYMIPAHFVPLEKLPLTSNGKIDRKALLEIKTAARTIPYISAEMLNRLQREPGPGMPAAVSERQGDGSPAPDSGDAAREALETYGRLEGYSREAGDGKIYYPLSMAQKVFYYIEKTYPDTACNNRIFTVKYPEIIDRSLLEEAINQVLEAHDAARLRVVEVKPGESIEPAQYVAPHKRFTLDSFDFSLPEQQQSLEKWVIEMNDKPFRLFDGDLFYFAYVRFNPEESGYLMKFHHLVTDRISLALVSKEIHRVYRRLLEGKAGYDEQTPPLSYIRQCLLQEKGYLESARMKADRDFWHKLMLPLPPEADLATSKKNPFNIRISGSIQTMPGALRSSMYEYCEKQGTSLFKLILSGLSLYISRVTGREHFVVGSVNHGRKAGLQMQTPGLFNRFFPIPMEIDGDMTFGQFVEKNSREIDYILKNHVSYPYELLNTDLEKITGKDVRYFGNINLIYHPGQDEEYTVFNPPSSHDANPLTIHINVNHRERFGILEVQWEYQVERFSAADIAGMQQGLVSVLEDALAHPGKPLAHIQLLSKEEKERILYEFNDTDAVFPEEKTIHRLFEEQVEKTPGAIAANGTSLASGANAVVTYKELNDKANRLAHMLQEKGVKTDAIVGIMVERSIEMLAGMMAILKVGGAYLAVSSTYPGKRVDFMCRDSRMPLLLVHKSSLPQLSDGGPLAVDVGDEENDRQNTANLPPLNRPGDTAAVFYTSGSTGTPKGTLLEHRGLVNRVHWMNRRYPIGNTDVILQKTAVIFDVSVWELFWWSFYGASVYLLPPDKGDNRDLVEAVREGKVTRMHFIPTPLVSFLNYVETAEGEQEALSTLKHVFASGEALPPLLVNRFNRLLYQNNGTRLYNLYGPTEASVDVSYFDCPTDSNLENVPIGKPIDNIRLYIVDNNLQLQPIGAAGQLCISGIGLARGYLNQPELTAEKFVFDFYRTYKSYKTNIYQTGDLARWLEDGNIEFLGRIDHQLQINGIRIEVGEIESALLKLKAIEEAVVIPRTAENGDLYLCAFIKMADGIGYPDFKETLAKELPIYMLPSRFVELERIPLTPSGKVDRKVLEVIDLEIDAAAEYVAPRSEKENLIADVWKEILHVDKLGINDNFFDLGGNSLAVIQVNLRLKEILKQDISALVMFEYPTIASMVSYLEQDSAPGMAVDGVGGDPIAGQDRSEKKNRGKNKMQQRRQQSRKARL